MDQPKAGLLSRHPWVPRRPLTVAEYHRMGEARILDEDDRVELIEGELVQMTPIGSNHSGTVNALNYLLVTAVREQAVALLRPKPDCYRSATPRPQDVLLIIEVADSSLPYTAT
ncbi:MAG TPA: Uma2 family endonuclease [Acetobacteraceae bacterium]|nr:Uma2 family endonuclease [Acetobacteraceae bacterium]